MDPQKIVQTLQASLQAEHREEAEKLLNEMQRMVGFGPTLLQIILEPSLNLSIRQSGGVFFKNMILKSWRYKINDELDGQLFFVLDDSDKNNIRSVIVAAIVNSEIQLQSILKVALEKILRVDYPSRFPNFVDQLAGTLNSSEFREFHGALSCLHALIKVCENKPSEKNSIIQIMGNLLPILHHRLGVLAADSSDNSLILQKLILKIFCTFTNSFIQPTVLNTEWITQWHILLCSLLEDFNGADDDDQSLYWKRQKWVTRTSCIWFNNYGSPGYVASKYNAFADWYLKSHVPQVLNSFLKICDAYRQKTFVSDIVMSAVFQYFRSAMLHSFSWKLLLVHFDSLLRDVIIPCISFNKETAELWEEDPLEFIRSNTDYETDDTACDAARLFIKRACTSRKRILDKCMEYCVQLLNSDVCHEVKDGAFHLIGTVCHNLLKNKVYKEQLENFMTTHVLALFEASEGYRRARACWLVGRLSLAEFNNKEILCQIAMMCRHLMCSDPDLPVRVAAAKTVFALINDQEAIKSLMSQYFPDLTMQLLKLLRETEFDDLNTVFHTLLEHQEIIPISVQILQHLSGTFLKIVGVQENGVVSADGVADGGAYNESQEYQCIVANGIMENIESIISVMEDNAELVAASEGVIAELIQIILKNEVDDFYDEALSLACSLTCQKISSTMWGVFEWLYQAYNKDASDYFSSMAPALHNYIELDPKGFLESQERVKMFTTMCIKELQKLEEDEDSDSGAIHAAKLLEVLIINYHGQLDSYIPEFIESAINTIRITSSTDLRIRCLLIIIASIITSSSLVLPIFCSHMWPETQTPILEKVLKIWLNSIHKFHGVHDQRVCVLGLCTLLNLSADQRPPIIDAGSSQFLPNVLHVLNALKDSYATKRVHEKEEEEEDDSEDDDDESEEDVEAVDSDADVVDEEGSKYLELLEAVEADLHNDDVDEGLDGDVGNDDFDDDYSNNSLIEAYTTEIDKEENEMDEYVTFYHLMTRLETSDTDWYQRLTSSLTEAQKLEFKEIAQTAVNCMAQKESKRIEKAGGYNFQQTDVPSSFNFSGDPPPQA
nr:importin 7 [Hymenolepis microstoma]